MNPVRSVLFFIGILLAPLLLYLLYGAGLWVLGYEFAKGPDVLAERLVEEGRPGKDCFLFRTLDLGPRPSTYELQMECVYDYASLTKDPEVCELLMPGEYGLSCIGAASEPKPCTLRPDRSVGGNGIYVSLHECLKGPLEIQRNECCTVARVNFLNGYDDCSSLAEGSAFSDQCFGELAEKKLDPSICSNIRNDNLRTACTIRVSALSEYPDLPYFAPIDYPQ